MLIEPVSSTAPRIPSTAKFDMIQRKTSLTVSILCQGQGYPVPNFRLVLGNRFYVDLCDLKSMCTKIVNP